MHIIQSLLLALSSGYHSVELGIGFAVLMPVELTCLCFYQKYELTL
jgi:hypothetical protein